ncbi:MAG: hypothetical protein HN900_05210 [Gammaproteobacteria bacterium]|nr:hypothetical protein [Pseudomonadota bacterium]MBT7174061.1 hypothetical protein [Gammaproteobacteria bacterium]
MIENTIVAKPNEHWARCPVALLIAKKSCPPTEQDIIDHCRASMAHFKMPRTVIFWRTAQALGRQDVRIQPM